MTLKIIDFYEKDKQGHMDFKTLKNKRQKNIQEQVVIDSPIPTLTVDNRSQS